MRIGVTSKAVSLSRIDPRQACKRKRRSNRQRYYRHRPCDSVGLDDWGLAVRVSVRGVSCLVSGEMHLVLRERIDKTCKAGLTCKTDKAPANSRTREALCPSDMLREEAGEALAL